MAMALSMYEASLTEDGIPAAVAYDDERGTWLEVRTSIDYGAAAKERWRQDNPKPEAGTVLRVVDTYKERKTEQVSPPES